MKHLLNGDFEVFGTACPGAGMETIRDMADAKVQKLTKKDIVVLWGGSNDIARNNSLTSIKFIKKFLTEAIHTNVILISAPHRHDLISKSCVNMEVKVFNEKLQKMQKVLKKLRC